MGDGGEYWGEYGGKYGGKYGGSIVVHRDGDENGSTYDEGCVVNYLYLMSHVVHGMQYNTFLSM